MGLERGASLNQQGISRFLILGYIDIVLLPPQLVLLLILLALRAKGVSFWPGWKATHASFSSISTVTSEGWRSSGFWTRFSLYIGQWSDVVKALGFFALFGLTTQKRDLYKTIFWKVIRPFGLRPRADQKASALVFATRDFPPVTSLTIDETTGSTEWVSKTSLIHSC